MLKEWENVGRQKITLIEVVKNDMSIKEVIDNMTLNIIECQKMIHVPTLTNLLRIYSRLQKFWD